MAALDFPTATSVGQTATLTNGVTYRWDGAAWTAGAVSGGGGGSLILTGSGPPTLATGAEGNYYIDTDTDTMYGPKAAGGGGFGPSETVLTGTPSGSFNDGPFKVGNTYQWHVGGQIVGARFHRHNLLVESSHTILLYNAAHVLVATSQPTSESAGTSSWASATFVTPILVAAGESWTLACNLTRSEYDTAPIAVADPAEVSFVTGVYGTYNDPGWPSSSGAFSFYVDPVWQPGSGGGDVWPVAIAPGGGTPAYRHVQATAATTWTIPHGLAFRPNVTTVDSTGRAIWCEVDYPSATTVTLTFSAAVGGEAYCS